MQDSSFVGKVPSHYMIVHPLRLQQGIYCLCHLLQYEHKSWRSLQKSFTKQILNLMKKIKVKSKLKYPWHLLALAIVSV